MTYNLGSLVTLNQIFTLGGTPTDPTNISLTVSYPDGTETVFTLISTPPITRNSIGNFTFVFIPTQVGIHSFVWLGAGALNTVNVAYQGTITVGPSLTGAVQPSPFDLATLDETKSWMGIACSSPGTTVTADTNTQDVAIQRAITRVSNIALNMMNRTTVQPLTITERRNGNGQDSMALYNWPIISVNSLTINGYSVAPSPDGLKPGYIADRFRVFLAAGGSLSGGGPLFFGSGCYAPGVQNIVFNYTHGLGPGDLLAISQAVMEVIAQKFARRQHVDRTQTSIAQEHVTFSTKSMPDEAKEVFQQYKIKGIIE